MTEYEFLNTPGKFPWHLKCPGRKPKSGIVYDVEGRLVCVAAIGNAREIVKMANAFHESNLDNQKARTCKANQAALDGQEK